MDGLHWTCQSNGFKGLVWFTRIELKHVETCWNLLKHVEHFWLSSCALCLRVFFFKLPRTIAYNRQTPYQWCQQNTWLGSILWWNQVRTGSNRKLALSNSYMAATWKMWKNTGTSWNIFGKSARRFRLNQHESTSSCNLPPAIDHPSSIWLHSELLFLPATTSSHRIGMMQLNHTKQLQDIHGYIYTHKIQYWVYSVHINMYLYIYICMWIYTHTISYLLIISKAWNAAFRISIIPFHTVSPPKKTKRKHIFRKLGIISPLKKIHLFNIFQHETAEKNIHHFNMKPPDSMRISIALTSARPWDRKSRTSMYPGHELCRSRLGWISTYISNIAKLGLKNGII